MNTPRSESLTSAEPGDIGCNLTSTGLTVHGNPTLDEFNQVGRSLRTLVEEKINFDRSVVVGHQWWWGDFVNFGELEYGERFAQALEATDWEESSLRQYAWVAKNVEKENRLDGVPFGHYLNGLASLQPAEQKQWAERILAENLTQGQFVARLKSESKKAGA